jgi:hypothetical protein
VYFQGGTPRQRQLCAITRPAGSRIRRITPRIRWMTPRIRWITPRIRTMSNLFVGCAATGADFAVPGVASSSGVRGVWLAPPFLVVWVWVGCWRLSLCMMYVFYLACLPVLLSVPASCHCDRCFCHPQHAVRSAYLCTFTPLERLMHLRLRSYACARCIFACARITRCMPSAYRGSFRGLMYAGAVLPKKNVHWA